jgi:hypothetical protein
VLTGIERAVLEERLAAERAAALAAAEAELERTLTMDAEMPQGQAAASAVVAPSPRRARRRTRWQRPTWVVGGAPSAARAMPFLAATVPLLGAVAIWGAAAVVGRLDLGDAELRPVSLALLATGPLAAIGALAARAWFPRLFGLVVVSSLAALLLVGRALLG